MASTSTTSFRKCIPMCRRFLTPDNTHDMCVTCLGEEYAHLLQAICRSSGPAAAEACRRLHSWGSQVELADKFEKYMNVSYSAVAGKSELPDDDVLSLTSSDSAASEAVEMEDVSERSQPACPSYDKLLDVMSRATERLDLPWKRPSSLVAPR